MNGKYVLLALTLCHLVRTSMQCGPGPSGHRRKKILKPMVLYQRLPDVEEESISGSGMFRRIVTESSKEYKELVKNLNKDIVFERGDGKRIMTKRCREKLDKLAKLVKNEWRNVKLRVIEAYDKHGQHPPNSLHYEARAVDITTSDRDKSKIGTLGSLAFQAGFDFVYYESHSYIHASVVSEKEVSLKQAECFPGASMVTTQERGSVSLKELRIGDNVLTYKFAEGKLRPLFTEVLGFLDNVGDVNQTFLAFKTDDGVSLETTKSHLVFSVDETRANFMEGKNVSSSSTIKHRTNDHDDKMISKMFYSETGEIYLSQSHDGAMKRQLPLVFQNNPAIEALQLESFMNVRLAKSLSIGDRIVTNHLSESRISTISSISEVSRRGAYAPLTREGTLIVEGVLVSSYAVVPDPDTAHLAFGPFRTVVTSIPIHLRQKALQLYVEMLKFLNYIFGAIDLH